ncbi:nucleophile aminohydrolase [Brevundimonas phage vB_BpoS-Kikimora]|uniref:Nucleophile aminohydrolase n=1 Tax=Brevundimonas phage vB_BpoS-Kikimora TaxID=2948601 RepID=A0A9E7MSD5_9CAUD|nr:nucleophile aminohydrolase [Brevundimonas phage vB_BpoS-Kikimora]
MTTIAYRDGVLASDSLVTMNGIREGSAVKIESHRGVLFGGVGTWAAVVSFMAWVRKGAHGRCPMESSGAESTGFIIAPSGHAVLFSEYGSLTVDRPYFALGSGRELALGAMAAGATASEAVHCALEYDIYSGGPVRVLTL